MFANVLRRKTEDAPRRSEASLSNAASTPDELAQAVVGSALRDQVRSVAAAPELYAALRGLCEAARSRGLRAEEVIILLKGAWRDLPDARALQHRETRTLSRLITLAIDEYYSDQRER